MAELTHILATNIPGQFFFVVTTTASTRCLILFAMSEFHKTFKMAERSDGCSGETSLAPCTRKKRLQRKMTKDYLLLDSSQPDSTVRQWNIGRKKFNIDPEKGLDYLIKNCLLNSTPEDIAAFLYKGEGLNKVKIGDYLGEKVDLNIQVLKLFVELHNFKGNSLADALREFLWNFRLPGEAQKIDRMMEAFAERFCSQNPNQFLMVDTCYVLSFSLIMLNTSLHNPNVKDKLTLEGFLNMNKGINDGGDLPKQMLEDLYEGIKNEPFRIPEDDGNDLTKTFFNPEREGMLVKEDFTVVDGWKQYERSPWTQKLINQSVNKQTEPSLVKCGLHKTWRPRYFILKDNCLYYFKNKGDKEPRGIIPLENLRVRENTESKKKFCFEIFAPSGSLIKACKTDSDGKVQTGHHDVYRICASSEEERQDWIKSIQSSITKDPFYEMLVARKKKATHLLQGPPT